MKNTFLKIISLAIPLSFALITAHAGPVFKIYQYHTRFNFVEGSADYRIEMKISQDESIPDSAKEYYKLSTAKDWLEAGSNPEVKFIHLTYTRDLTPKIVEKRKDIRFTKVDPRLDTVIPLRFTEGSSTFDFNYLVNAKELVRKKLRYTNVAAAPKEVKTASAVEAEPTHEVTPDLNRIESDGAVFTLERENDFFVIKAENGKQVRFAAQKGSRTFSVDDGILSIEGTSRKIDLRMFDAEVRFIGNTGVTAKVKTSKGMVDPDEEMNKLYPDLVEKERERMKAGIELSELDEDLSPEIKKIASALRMNKSVKLLGPAGSGKTSEIKAFARLIAAGEVRSIPRTAEIRLISLNSLQTGTSYVGMLEEKLDIIVKYAENKKPVVVMDEFHIAASAGVSEGAPSNMAQSLKPGLEEGTWRMIGISTRQEWNNAFASDVAFDERFDEVSITPSTGEALVKKIKNSFLLRKLPLPSDESIALAIKLSDRFAISGAQPRKAVNLLIKATSIMDEEGFEEVAATTQAVEEAAIQTYKIDPIFFNPKAVNARILSMASDLQSMIVGQRAAIQAKVQFWFKKFSDVGDEKGAQGAMFIGPPGTGKTLLAKRSAEVANFKAKLIEMNKYANGDIEAFRYEIFQALRESPNMNLILDEFEKATLTVQNAVLSMLGSGTFTVNFKDPGGRYIFEEVHCSNAVIDITTNAGQSLMGATLAPIQPVGYKAVVIAAAPLKTKTALPLDRMTKVLAKDGISEPVISRYGSSIYFFALPTLEDFRESLEHELTLTLEREGKKRGMQFKLSNRAALIDELATSFVPESSDFRLVKSLLQTRVEPMISQAVIHPDFDQAKIVRIVWTPKLDQTAFPTSENLCNSIMLKADRPLKTLLKQ